MFGCSDAGNNHILFFRFSCDDDWYEAFMYLVAFVNSCVFCLMYMYLTLTKVGKWTNSSRVSVSNILVLMQWLHLK